MVLQSNIWNVCLQSVGNIRYTTTVTETTNLSFGVVRFLDAADSLRLFVPRGAVDEEEVDD